MEQKSMEMIGFTLVDEDTNTHQWPDQSKIDIPNSYS